MSQISLKSISGITSITTPSGVDNQLTVHTNDTTQRVKVTQSGIDVTGVVTATSFSGSGANLTGIDATTVKDSSGNVRVSGTPTGAVVSGILTATASMNVKQSGNAYVNILSTGTGNAGIFMDASNGDIAGSDYCSIYQKNDLDLAITNRKNSANIIFETGGENERLRIDENGNVGIDQSNPSAYGKFVVNGTGNIINLRASSGAASLGFFEAGTGRFYIKTLNGSDGLSFVDADNTTERMNIASDGHVAITTTGALKVPAGTTAQRPGSSVTGDIRYNSSSQTLEFYTGSAWIGTNAAPAVNSVTGEIYNGVSGRTLVINCSDISASGNNVKYSNNSTGATIATDTSASTSTIDDNYTETAAVGITFGVNIATANTMKLQYTDADNKICKFKYTYQLWNSN